MDENAITVGRHRIRLAIQPGVFPPSIASLLLASRMNVKKGDVACDLTTGCGIHAIAAAKQGAKRVTAMDIDSNAISNARYNAAINGVERQVHLETTSFSTYQTDDSITYTVFNAPQTPQGLQPPGGLSMSLQAGKDGADMNVAALQKAARITIRGGTILFTIDAIANPSRVIQAASQVAKHTIVARHRCVARLFELDYCRHLAKKRRKQDLWVGLLDGLPAYEKIVLACLRI